MRGRYAPMHSIPITRSSIEIALPKLALGLGKYEWLQAELPRRDPSRDHEYQRRFNSFYRVRRGSDWQRPFYRLLQEGKTRRLSFAVTLRELHQATGRVEASFASKLIATLDTSQPVIDSIVLRHLGLKLPASGPPSVRIDHIVTIHESLAARFAECLAAPIGGYLVARFRTLYPQAAITGVKMLDLILWQTRDAA
jgi:hypothetical protein